MNLSQIKKNFIYNVCYQILILILPLLTVPYVSRILSAEGIGIYSYTYSIVYYFMLIAMLGINNYGNRTIAKVRDNKIKLSKSFFSIYAVQLIMSFLMIFCYFIYIAFFLKKYKLIAIIQFFHLLSAMFDINWFFFGIEKFKVTVTRNMILKVLSAILIFLFVKNENDVWIYTLILSSSTLISQLLLFPLLKKEIIFVEINLKEIIGNLKPCLILFIPVIAVSLYKIMDKIMLGILSGVMEVGYYEQAEKIINIPLGLVTALGTVMLPRISNLLSKGNKDSVLNYLEKSVKFMMFLAFPICFGIISIASNFVPIFLGNDFSKSIILIYYLSVTILFLAFANVIRTQYLIPKEKDNVYIISVCLGAVINLVINLVLIPKYQSIGACIGTVFAEFLVMFYQILAVKKELPVLKYLKDIIPFFIKSLFMFFVVVLIKYIYLSPFSTIILQIIVGIVVYMMLNWSYINSIVDIKNILIKIRKRFLK